MERYNCVQGDRTTVGGTIIGATDNRMTNMGRALAMEGDAVYCPACKSTGRILCVEPRHDNSFHSRRDALSDDLCLCNCVPKPRLIHSTTNMSHRFRHEELLAMGLIKRPVESGFCGEAGHFDEQVQMFPQIQGAKLAGLPFFIETTDGRRFSGKLDAHGQLPRIATREFDTYEIFWGDEALQRG